MTWFMFHSSIIKTICQEIPCSIIMHFFIFIGPNEADNQWLWFAKNTHRFISLVSSVIYETKLFYQKVSWHRNVSVGATDIQYTELFFARCFVFRNEVECFAIGATYKNDVLCLKFNFIQSGFAKWICYFCGCENLELYVRFNMSSGVEPRRCSDSDYVFESKKDRSRSRDRHGRRASVQAVGYTTHEKPKQSRRRSHQVNYN